MTVVSASLGTMKDAVLTRVQGVDGDDAMPKELVAFLHHSHPEGGQLRHQDLMGGGGDSGAWSSGQVELGIGGTFQNSRNILG